MAESYNPTRQYIIGYFDRNNSENAIAVINHVRIITSLHENTEETLINGIIYLEWNYKRIKKENGFKNQSKNRSRNG